MTTAEDFQNGKLLLIDKPLGWTSFQAVNKMKWVLKSKLGLKKIKIGHAGTLDPLATGLLLVMELPLMSLKFRNFNWDENMFRYILLISAVFSLLIFKFAGVPVILFTYIILSIIQFRIFR